MFSIGGRHQDTVAMTVVDSCMDVKRAKERGEGRGRELDREGRGR